MSGVEGEARLLPEGLWRWWPVAALPVLALGEVRLSPDAVELAAAGGCLWRLPVDSGACAGLEPWFWPPLFPLLAGLPVALGVDPALAAVVLSVACMALLTAPVAWLVARWAGPWGAVLGGATLLGLPALSAHARMGEARPLCLLLLLSGAALAWERLSRTGEQPVGRGLIWPGLLLGLAALARPEAALTGGLLCLAVAGRALHLGRRRGAGLVFLGFLAPLLPYWAALSAAAGSPTLTSRGWQARVYGWLAVLPEDWVRLDLAAGAWGTPLRRVLSTEALAPAPPDTLAPVDAAQWLGFVAQESVPPWLLVAALGGAVLLLLARSWGLPGLVALLVLPAVPVMLLPQAQDLVLPANNALPLLVGLVLLGAVGLCGVVGLLGSRSPGLARGVGGGMAVGLLLLGLLGRYGGEDLVWTSPAMEEARAWMSAELPAEATVAASLASSPAVLRAERQRRFLPSPWTATAWREGAPPADWIVLSSLDMPGAAASLRALEERVDLVPVASFGGAEDWAMVLEVRERP